MMTLRNCMIVLSASLALVGIGCGGDSGGSGGGGTTGSTGVGGAGGGDETNDCSASKAKDETKSADVTITFGDPDLAYSPACITIAKGSKVTFKGDFVTHPLQAGVVPEGGTPTVDDKSPIKNTSTGTTKTFTFPDAGTFGYYCNVHFSVGMYGAVIVK